MGLDPCQNRRCLRAGHCNAGDAPGSVARLLLHVQGRPVAQVGLRLFIRSSALLGSPTIVLWCLCRYHARNFQHRRALPTSSTSALCWHFTIVCAGVWILRVRPSQDGTPRSRPRWCHWLPILGILSAVYLIVAPHACHLDRDDRLAAHWPGHLLRVFNEAQQGGRRCRWPLKATNFEWDNGLESRGRCAFGDE